MQEMVSLFLFPRRIYVLELCFSEASLTNIQNIFLEVLNVMLLHNVSLTVIS